MSQTFCDTEILALEKIGVELELYSIYPPPTSFRHGHAARINAEVHYAPPAAILKLGEQQAKRAGRWPAALIAEHDRRYGAEYKAALRARNALYFADLFKRRGITHFHVHFANRAAHTAIFVKALSGIPFSISTHGQDFMSDLGSDELLREICREAEFIANETEFSKSLVAKRAPDSEAKMLRVFNGMELANFGKPGPPPANETPRILSVGRLIEFKGFHHLITACEELRRRGLKFSCDIIGEGPWRQRLQAQIDAAGADPAVRLLGALPQETIFEQLRGCDIFALACTRDEKGATDVFPTVILEAMASSKPVVSTCIAGVPEQVEHEKTGLLVEPGAELALADALTRLLESAELRAEFGRAGRQRLEAEFAVEQTVRPLHARFVEVVAAGVAPIRVPAGCACLLEEWPAGERVEAELRQLRQSHPPLRVYVVQAGSTAAPNPEIDISQLDFLPDAMVLEAEWQQERELAWQMETWRVELGQKQSSELFLQSARRALYLRRWIARDGVAHLHAMSARELLCAWMLHRLCGVSYSVSLEEKSAFLPQAVVLRLTRESVGLRIAGGAAAAEAFRAEPNGSRQTVIHHRHGRALEPEWLARLVAWARKGVA